MPIKRHRSTSPPPSYHLSHHAATSRNSPQSSTQRLPSAKHSVADLFPYQEIFLRILTFLDPSDLALVQGVSKYWSRMALDPQIWKRLYLRRYPHPHHSRLIYRGAANSTPSKALRPIARLPSRAFPPPSPSRSPAISAITSHPIEGYGKATALPDRESVTEEVGYGVRNDGVDWKMMLRLGTNWSNGNALSESSITLPPSPAPTNASLLLDGNSTPSSRPPPYSEQHIALFPSFIFTSNPNSPLVQVHRSTTESTTAPSLGIIPPPPGWSSPSRPDNITAICADLSVVPIDDTLPTSFRPSLPARLAVFYQSGGFVTLRVRLIDSRLSWVRESIHPPRARPRSARRRATTYSALEGDPVVLATFHYPILLTCTLAFHLSVYTLAAPRMSGEPTQPKHLRTMHSDVSLHPAALTLFPAESNGYEAKQQFKAALTYCTPVYPASWTVAVQEFGVELDGPAQRTEQSIEPLGGDVWRGECWNVGRGDEIDDEEILCWPRKVRPTIGVKGRRAVGVGTDGRWCVLAGEDNQIQVYSLPTPPPSPPHSTSPPKATPIVHSQTLLAHSAAVTSICLSAGRCVSGGRDGRVLVWELDEDDDAGSVAHEGRVGRTIGYVEVRPGGRRTVWRGAAGPEPEPEDSHFPIEGLPHPASISSAARSFFLPRPPELDSGSDRRLTRPRGIRQLAFDEEKIVGLVSLVDGEGGAGGEGEGEVMKVWSFNS